MMNVKALISSAIFCLAAGSAAADGVLIETQVSDYGVFRGVRYVIHQGVLEGDTSNGAYRVPYEIVTPAKSTRNNGRVLLEPSHFAFRLIGRDSFLGPSFLFRRGYTHAGIGWSNEGLSLLDPEVDGVFIEHCTDSGDVPLCEDPEILVDFAEVLRDAGFVRIYAYGYSQTSVPIHQLVHSSLGPGLFDMLVLNATFPVAGVSLPHIPQTGVGKVLVVQTEGDVLLWDGDAFRGNDMVYPSYRAYEIAGAPHIPDTAEVRRALPFVQGTTPLDWTVLLRATFATGDRWTRTGMEPPPSSALKLTHDGSAIARDADGNALGGVRLPDLHLGRGRFSASDPENFPEFPLVGGFIDLQCEPRSDGSRRFASHRQYVRRFIRATLALVRARRILRIDAVRLVRDAAASEVGNPKACAGPAPRRAGVSS